MHNKGTGPSVYTIVLSYNNSVIKVGLTITSLDENPEV